MIYYNGEFVNYKEPKLDTSGQGEAVRKQMDDINARFFNPKSAGFAIIRYPKGARKLDPVTGTPYPPKPFAVSNRSQDRMWVYSKVRPTLDAKGNQTFIEPNTYVRDPYMCRANDTDKEFLWFLINHSSAVRAKILFVEDLEEEARKEARKNADDIDVKFIIYGKQSPVSRDEQLLRDVALALGIQDVQKKGIYQVKNALYGIVTEGERTNNKFVNFDIFDKLVNGRKSLKTATTIRSAIGDGTLKFNKSDYTWYLAQAGDLIDAVMKVAFADIAHKEDKLIDAALKDDTIRATIFGALGLPEFDSVEELKEFRIQALQTMCKTMEIATTPTDKKDDLIKKICDKRGIKYQ